MYDQPTALDLMKQMAAQRLQLDYLRGHAGARPGAPRRPVAQGTGGQDRQPTAGRDPDRAVGEPSRGIPDRSRRGRLLHGRAGPRARAVAHPRGQALGQGRPAEQQLTGAEIVERLGDPDVCTMSRNGGLGGMALQNDIPGGKWRKHHYEVSAAQRAGQRELVPGGGVRRHAPRPRAALTGGPSSTGQDPSLT